jgi:hypothetical protein
VSNLSSSEQSVEHEMVGLSNRRRQNMFMGFDVFYLVIEARFIYLPAAPLLGFQVPRL